MWGHGKGSCEQCPTVCAGWCCPRRHYKSSPSPPTRLHPEVHIVNLPTLGSTPHSKLHDNDLHPPMWSTPHTNFKWACWDVCNFWMFDDLYLSQNASNMTNKIQPVRKPFFLFNWIFCVSSSTQISSVLVMYCGYHMVERRAPCIPGYTRAPCIPEGVALPNRGLMPRHGLLSSRWSDTGSSSYKMHAFPFGSCQCFGWPWFAIVCCVEILQPTPSNCAFWEFSIALQRRCLAVDLLRGSMFSSVQSLPDINNFTFYFLLCPKKHSTDKLDF